MVITASRQMALMQFSFKERLKRAGDQLKMYGGVTAEYASVDTIYNSPRHPYTQELLKAFPDLSQPEKRLISIPGYPPRLDALPPGCRFAPRCPLAFDRCSIETPVLHSLNGGDHIASCHLVEENQLQRRQRP